MTQAELDRSAPRSALEEIAALAHQVEDSAIAREAQTLAQRLAEGRFYVACLGQFKRGKSTLINALVGRAVLPMGVAPVTSVATVLRYGADPGARVQKSGAEWTEIELDDLSDYVTEARNPGNAKGVLAVEVFLPSPLLERGLCLVDTPGIGSVFSENTVSTREFLPQVDAALVVLGGDPPITGEELGLLEQVARRVGPRLFVFAKADRLPEGDRREAIAFTHAVLAKRLPTQRGAAPIIWEVSATEVLSSGYGTRDWPAFVRTLEHLAVDAGADLVAVSERRGVSELVQRLLAATDQRIEVLQRPREESERRLSRLRGAISQAERALRDVAPLFAAEEARLLRTVEDDRDEWLRTSGPRARQALETILTSMPDQGAALRDRVLAEASEVARRWLSDWGLDEGPKLDRLFRAGMQRFVELLAGVEQALTAALGPGAPRALPLEPGIRAASQFYMTEMLAAAPTSMGRRLLDTIGAGWEKRRAAIGHDALAYLDRLLDVNSARLKNDFRERLAASRQKLETEVRQRLADLMESSEQSIERARMLHQGGAAQVEIELGRLKTVRECANLLAQRAANP